MTIDREVFGWRVRSEMALPDLSSWQGDGREPDILVTCGPIPAMPAGTRTAGPAVQIAPDGRVRFSVPGVAAYLVERGEQVRIEAVLPADAPDIRVFLLGTVLGILCYQRGILPLHAAAVEIDGRATILAGPSGIGKSTLAAALVSRGHRMLADDLCAVRREADGSVRVLPSFPRVRLWRDALEALGVSPEGLEQSRAGMEKYHLPVDMYNDGALRPGAFVCLSRSVTQKGIATQAIRGYAAVKSQAAVVYRYRLGVKLGAHTAGFGIYTTLVQTSGLTVVRHQPCFRDLPALSAAIEELAAPR